MPSTPSGGKRGLNGRLVRYSGEADAIEKGDGVGPARWIGSFAEAVEDLLLGTLPVGHRVLDGATAGQGETDMILALVVPPLDDNGQAISFEQ